MTEKGQILLLSTTTSVEGQVLGQGGSRLMASASGTAVRIE